MSVHRSAGAAAQRPGEAPEAIARAYLSRLDCGLNFFDLFADDAVVLFPKWGIAQGRTQYEALYGDVAGILRSIQHDAANFTIIHQGDILMLEGTSRGVTAKGIEWRAGKTHAGRFCDVFEISDGLIRRLHIYLDPDYGDEDLARYPWLQEN